MSQARGCTRHAPRRRQVSVATRSGLGSCLFLRSATSPSHWPRVPSRGQRHGLARRGWRALGCQRAGRSAPSVSGPRYRSGGPSSTVAVSAVTGRPATRDAPGARRQGCGSTGSRAAQAAQHAQGGEQGEKERQARQTSTRTTPSGDPNGSEPGISGNMLDATGAPDRTSNRACISGGLHAGAGSAESG